MKSASKIFSYLILTLLVFSCGSSNIETNNAPIGEKAYILLRTEGSEIEINRLSGILNSDFYSKNLQSNVVYYPPGKEWDINEIFTNSYEKDVNYIVLIDQVAKFTIDGKTNVGGKYQIRSYNTKAENPDWNDLGQKTCNVSVKESVAKFSQQIVNAILPRSFANNSIALGKDSNAASKNTGIDYNNLKTSSGYDAQITELKNQLEAEKTNTDEAIAKKERLSKEYQSRLSTKKEQNRSIVVGLDSLRKEIEQEKKLKQEEQIAMADAAEVKLKEELRLTEEKRLKENEIAEKKEQERLRKEAEKLAESKQKESLKLEEQERKKQEVIARKKEQKRKKLEQEKLAEVKRLEELNLKEQKRLEQEAKEELIAQERQKINEEQMVESDQKDDKKIKVKNTKTIAVVSGPENGELDKMKAQKKSSEKKQDKGINSQSVDKEFESDVFLVIVGFEKDMKRLKDLKDHLEFDFLFANLKTKSTLFNKSTTIDKTNFLNWNKGKFQYLIIIEQLDSINDAQSTFKLSIHSDSKPNSWTEIDDLKINLSDRTSMKNFSKKVLNLLR